MLHAQKGLTIVEVAVTTLLISLIGVGLWTAFRDNLTLSRRTHASLVAQQDLQILGRRFAAETRAAGPSETGAFAIAVASSSEFSFYTDADNDGLNERIRYFVSGTELKKGTLVPSGNPPAYVAGTETVRTVVRDVLATSTPVFQYYDTFYAGTSTALAVPVDVALIRLVKIFLVVDADTKAPPDAVISTTQASFRTLKDNL